MQNKKEDLYYKNIKSSVNNIVCNNQSSYTAQSIVLNLDEEETKNSFLTLIVDENAVNRMVAKNFLRMIGASIMEAKNARSAVEIILDYPVKLILMDYTMSDMEGLELVARIKGFSGEKSNIPIIGMMGKVDDDIRKKFLEAGAVDIIKKPLELSTLQNAISKIFSLDKVETKHMESKSSKEENQPERPERPERSKLSNDLKEVPNLDCNQGLDYVMSDTETYIKILKTSVISISECIEHLQSYMKDGNERNDIKELLNIKSILCQAGSDVLAKFTVNMVELFEKDLSSYQSKLPVYIDQLQIFKNSLEHALRAYNMLSKDNIKQEKGEKDDRATVIDAVIYHAKRFEYKYMLEQIEELRTILDNDKMELLEKASTSAERFDYDGVVRVMKELRY